MADEHDLPPTRHDAPSTDDLGPRAVRSVALEWPDWWRLHRLPWGLPLDEWVAAGVQTLSIRRGESRHPVLFVEAGGRRYAIKETSPVAAAREIHVFEELVRRQCRTIAPVGTVITAGPPIEAGRIGGHAVYLSGDTGYCITRLAERVLPQSILYRYPFTDANKRLLWSAIAELLLSLHESGVYWGDPSLANILIDLSDHRLTAVMADAETAQVVTGALGEGMRRQDLESFLESLAWQAEDIRIARGLPEEETLVTEGDAHYFLARYAGLREERQARVVRPGWPLAQRLGEVERRMRRLNALGYGVLSLGTWLPHPTRGLASRGVAEFGEVRVATVRPGWYVRQVRELLGEQVPRATAAKIFHAINVHKWLLSERAGHDVGMDEAVRDWQAHYHQPLLAFLRATMPLADSRARYHAYAEILDHTWEMSQRQQRPISIEEGAMDYALRQTPPQPEQ